MIVLGAVLALAAPRLPRSLAIAALAILALAAFGNAIFGAYHAGVEWGFWQGPATCSGPLTDLGSASDLLKRLDTVKVIRCDEVQWRFLGVSLAGYNFLISGLMGLVAAVRDFADAGDCRHSGARRSASDPESRGDSERTNRGLRVRA